MEKIVGDVGGDRERGITLVEVLASLSILSIILILASSVHLFGLKQVSTQSKQIQNQSDDRLAIKLITKEIRKASKVEVNAPNVLTIDGVNYQLKGTNLQKGSEIFIPNINKFLVAKYGVQIKLTIDNLPETIIYLRE